MKKIFCILFLLISFKIIGVVDVIEQGESLYIKTEYGHFEIHEKVLIELIKSPSMERLKLIHQYGVDSYAKDNDWFSRFDHSIGVFVLLRHFGATMEEQIAGLLHDVSHTVFSHVGDFVFDSYFNRYSYQDDIHEWFLEQTELYQILKKFGYETCCSNASKINQKMLEQDRPDLCLDRVEYLIRGGLNDKILSEQEVQPILDNLVFENGIWFFKNQMQAKKLALIALWLSENIFGAAWDQFINLQAANALKRSMEIGVLTLHDIHFSSDDIVWQKMLDADDEIIKNFLNKIINYQDYFEISHTENYDLYLPAKCLGIDPLVKTESGCKRLTEVDPDFSQEYTRVNELLNRGWHLKLIE